MTQKKWFKPTLWGFFILILVGGGILAYQAAHTFGLTSPFAINDGFSFTKPTATLRPGEPTPTLKPGETPEVPSIVDLGYDAWDGAERVTILIMGLDERDWESGEGAPRTDTMILFDLRPTQQNRRHALHSPRFICLHPRV
ncbi:MAG: hypothetical protein HC806_04280 [Anaerolineae bacterium]|nr:hypothetical protein [Anaerolineae bacterium]